MIKGILTTIIYTHRAFVTLFGLAWFAISFLFFIAASMDAQKKHQTRSWASVACTIEESSFKTVDSHYQFNISYKYVYEGKEYKSDVFSLQGLEKFKDYKEVQEFASQYEKGKLTLAFVNPESPHQAVLIHQSVGESALILLFLLGFMFLGVYILHSAWSRQNEEAEEEPDQENVSENPFSLRGKSPKQKIKILIGCSALGLFIFIGSRAILSMIFIPMWNVSVSSAWVETPCEIISSGIQSRERRSKNGGQSYVHKVKVFYKYLYEEKEYKSDRYDFTLGSSSNGNDKRHEIVINYKPKDKTVCFVDPNKPWSAVLVRDYRLNKIILAAILILCLGLPIFFIYMTIKLG